MDSMELFQAHNQWATRPADERFDSLEDMYDVTLKYANSSAEAVIGWNDIRVESVGDDIRLVGKAGVPAEVTHYAFGQLASRVKAPAGYLRGLPGTIAAQNLNFGLANRLDTSTEAQLLFHQNSGLLLRAATSTRYNRIWNHEVIDRMLGLATDHHLVPAQATMNWDGSPLSEDDEKSLYASDHDMFAFLMSDNRVVMDPMGKPLRRGIIGINSEVGDSALKFMSFYFRDVCANHIIWGASSLAEVSFVHTGNVWDKMKSAVAACRLYMDGAASQDEARMNETTVKIGYTREDVIGKLAKLSLGLSKKALKASYDAVVPDEDGDATTVWGMAQGITRHSQTLPYADERMKIDRAAGKLLQITF